MPLTLQELQSSSFYSGKDLLRIQDYTPPDIRPSLGHRVLLFLLLAFWRVTWVFAWLVLLVQLGSVLWWLAILTPYLILSFSLSRLRGGTRFNLPLILLVLLPHVWRGIVLAAAGLWSRWPRFTLSRRWQFVALTLWGSGFLYAETIWLLQRGR